MYLPEKYLEIGGHIICKREIIPEIVSKIWEDREEILGTASMGSRILCEHSRSDRGTGKAVCEVAGKAREGDWEEATDFVWIKAL